MVIPNKRNILGVIRRYKLKGKDQIKAINQGGAEAVRLIVGGIP